MEKKTQGAWLIHHGGKLQQFAQPMFESIQLAAKAGVLLSLLSESSAESTLSREKVEALCRPAGINPRLELDTLIETLRGHRLVDRSTTGEVVSLGLTTSTVLSHTADIFVAETPRSEDNAVLELAEMSSSSPVPSSVAQEYIGDAFTLANNVAANLVNQSTQIGFIDAEAVDDSEKLLFNGNLFRIDSAQKVAAVLGSLSSADEQRVSQLNELLQTRGCILYSDAVRLVGEKTLSKFLSIGMYDANTVKNSSDNVAFLTRPAAFGKFGNPFTEDALDLAKALVTALTYGITRSSPGRGRITMPTALIRKLISGAWVGPASAIGEDYRVLELKRVIELRRDTGSRYSMRLLKPEVGELALEVISTGDVTSTALPTASVSEYVGPERNRELVRKQHSSSESRRQVAETLRVLRTGGDF